MGTNGAAGLAAEWEGAPTAIKAKASESRRTVPSAADWVQGSASSESRRRRQWAMKRISSGQGRTGGT